MARYTGPVCRLCRREGTKLFLKGTKCFSEKCPIEKRNFAPGQHGRDRKPKIVGYGLQLREKQKAKRIYFTLESQFRAYYEKASRAQGVTGELLLQQLERRLGQRSFPSRLCQLPPPGAPDRAPRPRGSERPQGEHSFLPGRRGRRDQDPRRQQETHSTRNLDRIRQPPGTPRWLQVDHANLSGKVLALPKREDVNLPVNEQLIVELYSK